MKGYTRRQLGVILTLLIFLCPFSFVQTAKGLLEREIAYYSAPAFIYEVRGAVKTAGFYSFKQSQTIKQLVEAAGGFREKNNLSRCYLLQDSSKIESGKRIIFTDNITIEDMAAEASLNFFKPICINSATAEDLRLITGIGPKAADAIVAYREKHGSIRHMQELEKIPGIGGKKVKSLLPYLTVISKEKQLPY